MWFSVQFSVETSEFSGCPRPGRHFGAYDWVTMTLASAVGIFDTHDRWLVLTGVECE